MHDDKFEEDVDEQEEDEEPESMADVAFTCPFCGAKVFNDGGCPHFVFSYELVNFEYLLLDKTFEELALQRLRSLGYAVSSLPCPLAEWAWDDNDKAIPSLDDIMPGLKLSEYRYNGPHGHGSWGVVIGFLKEKN